MLDLSIIIVNYNTRNDLLNCLKSIYKYQKKIKLEVIVVDNASFDKSTKMVKQHFPQVKLISNKTNRYFTKAYNQGYKKAKGKYVLHISPDSLILSNTLTQIISFMEKCPDCTAFTVKQINYKNIPHNNFHKFHTPLIELLKMPLWQKFFSNSKILNQFYYQEFYPNTVQRVESFTGSVVVMKRYILKTKGLWDEKFKLFYSDDDFCKKLTEEGYHIYYNGKITVKHLQKKSLGDLNKSTLEQIAASDMKYYYQKYFGSLTAIFLYWIWKTNSAIYFFIKNLLPLKNHQSVSV